MEMASISRMFSSNNTDQMRIVENQTRQEIETKKEELRQMVGERYRDLIEAADTITEMKKCAADVKTSIIDLQHFCSKISLSKLKKETSSLLLQSNKNSSRYLEIAAQAKALLEIPEEIWSEVENGNMVNASLLYLQSLDVLANLSLDGSTSYIPILQYFPMLGQQAQAIGNIRKSLLKQSNLILREYMVDSNKVAEALCSIILLERSSLLPILDGFLSERHEVLLNILESDSTLVKGTKNKICEIVQLLIKTVWNVHDLFSGKGLVTEILKSCLNPNYKTDSIWSTGIKLNGKSVVDFELYVFEIASNDIQKSCLDWLLKCNHIIQQRVGDLLIYTTTAKDLSTIRLSVKEILSYYIDDQEESHSEKWETSSLTWPKISSDLFDRQIEIWDEFFEDLFMKKINSLVQSTFNIALSQSISALDNTKNTNMDVCSYIWQEHESDISSNMAWNTWQNRKNQNLSSQSGLTLKALMILPNLHSTYQTINDSVLSLLNDLQHYSGDITSIDSNDGHESQQIKKVLQLSCYDFLNSVVLHLTNVQEDLKKLPAISELNRAVQLSLVCRNFFDVCYVFRQCCYTKPQKRRLSTSQKEDDNASWNRIVSDMINQSRGFMAIWCDINLASVLQSYKESLLNSVCNDNILLSVATWSVLDIVEESEFGDKVSSKIKIPSTTTSFTQQLLYRICRDLNLISGYSASRFTLNYLIKEFLNGILKSFSEARESFSSADTNLHGQSNLENETPSQIWALQCLFDLRYLHHLMYQPPVYSSNTDDFAPNDGSFTFTELVDWLESYIDPFDLDVFSSHLTDSIQQHFSRTCLMYGVLVAPDKLTSVTKYSSSTTQSHNLLPIMPDCGRFSYLPVTGRSATTKQNQRLKINHSRPLSNALHNLTKANEDQEEQKSNSIYSKLGALSSSWLSMSSSYSE